MLQKTETHRERLIKEKKINERKNNKNLSTNVLLAIVLWWSLENTEAAPIGRVLSLVFLVMFVRWYNHNKNSASSELSYYDHECLFREAAKSNDVKHLKGYLKITSEQEIYKPDQDTGRNSLHFAVASDAEEAIYYLLSVDDRLNRSISIINYQDNKGNTPVHEALLEIINNKKTFETLLKLISRTKEGIKIGFINDPSPPINIKIDPTLKNHEDKTIQDLFSEILGKGPDFLKAKMIIEKLCTSKLIEETPTQQAGK